MQNVKSSFLFSHASDTQLSLYHIYHLFSAAPS